MELPLMIGWQEERAELRAEVSRMQDELAESRADREELESRVQALTDRLTQTLDPSLPQLFINEQKEWQNKLRYGRERESRQAVLIQKLQSKVLDYKARFQALQQQTISGKREMRMREKVLRDERSDTLESTLIRLEEEQQRSLGLSEVSVLLRSQLSHSTEANEELKDDLRKLTFDWSKAVEELVEKDIELQKEKENLTGLVGKEQTRLMTLWGRVVTLRRQCHSLKTATDKDLWELRAEFSRLCSSLLARTSILESSRTHFTTTQPLSSSQGPMSLDDLEQEKRVQDSSELRAIFESESLELRNRITELHETIKTLQSGREKQEAEMERRHKEEMERKQEEEKKWEQRIELERNYESVRHAVRTLSGVLSSQQLSGQSILPVGDASSEDLSSVLSVIAQAESTLHWRQQEIQDAQISLRRLGSEKESLEQRIKLLESEKVDLQEKTNQGELQIKHTQQLLNSEKDEVNSLQSQLKEAEKLLSELKQENEHVTQQRAKEEEKRIQMESERQKRVEAEMLEIAQLSERETHTRLELYSLKGALEREKLDRARAEQEAADKNNSLIKAQESFSALSTRQTQLERDLAEGQDALKKMAISNEILTKDKQELCVRVLQLETELAVYQNQIQTLDSELVRLRREIKTVMIEADELRITELKETIKTLQSGREKQEAEMERRHKEEMERKHEEERKWEQRIELERNYESVRHAVRTLSGVLSSQQLSGQSILPVGDASSEDLSSVLSVIAQAESTLHWRQQEIQDAHISLHQLGSEKESLEQRIKLLESEKVDLQEKTNQGELQINHTQQLLNSEKDEVNSLKSQLDDGEKLLSELKQENEHVTQQRAKEEEKRMQMESEMQKQITELNETIKTLQSGREKQEAEMERRHKEEMERKHEEEKKWEQHIELERNYESVRHAVRTLSGVLSSQHLSGQSILPVGDVSSEDLSSVLSVIAQAESTLHWRQQEIQDAQISLRRLGSEKESLEQRIKLLESEKVDLQEKTNHGELQIKHTQQLLNSEKDEVNSLQSQLKEAEKLLSELKQDNEHVTQQRAKEEEKRIQMESERQKRITELNETIKTLQSGREKQEAEMERRHKEEMERKQEEERKWEQRIELERNYESVRHAVRTLSGVLSSQQLSGQSILPVGDASSEDLSSVLSVIAQAESTLHWRQQEIQDAHIILNRLGTEKEFLEQRIKLLESEKVDLQEKTNQGELQIKHTQQLLNSEKDEVNSLQSQLKEAEKLLSELKQENEHVTQQRAKEEEKRMQMESERQKRITELNETIKTLQSGREKQEAEMERRHKEEMERKHEEEKKWEQHIELERNYESVRHAVRTLSGVLSSQQLSGQSILPVGDVSSEDLSSVLSVIAQAESTLHWRQQEIQDAQISLRRLGSEKESLEQRIKLLESEKVDLQEKTNQGEMNIKHTEQLLNSEKDEVNSLQSQLKEAEKLLSELKQENEHVTQQRAKEEEKRNQMESERQKRVEAEMLEIAQLSERETHTRLELYSLKGALEREKLDRARAEQEAADKNNSLLKAQESFSALSTKQTQLERDLAEGQDALKKMAISNEFLTKDKQELCARVLQLETELAVYQNQIQTLDSELVRLRREIKTVMIEADELREQREADVKKLHLLQNRTSELEMERGYVEHVLEGNVINGELNVKFTQTCSNQMTEVQSMFQDDLDTAEEGQRCEITVCALQRKNEQLTMNSEELRYSETSCHMSALFRGLVESQQQQEVHCSRLDSQGQFQSTRIELIGESSQRENENQEASEERIDIKRKKENQKHSGIEHEFLRFMEWQKEQEALNSELKQKDGITQRNKTDGLDRQEDMLHATQIPHTELENLRATLGTERNSPDNEQRERYTEMDRWTNEEIESVSEYGESFQSFGDQEKEEFQIQKIPEREHKASNLLQKLVEGLQNSEEGIEELKSKFQSFERKNENLQSELQKKNSLESRIEALEQQNTYLKETECVNKRENVGREEQIDELKTLEEKNEELMNLKRRDENWVTTKMTSFLKKEDDEEEYYEPKCRVQSLELSVKKLETEAEYKNIQINLLTKENLELKNMAKDKHHKFGQLQADQNELEKHLKKEIEDLNYNIERVFKEKEMALAMVEQKVQEMKELQDDFIREKSIFEEKIKAEHEGMSKLRAEMVEIKSEQKRREERAEDRRKRCEFEEKERERRLREELTQKESQSKQLRQKIHELEQKIEEDTRARLKQVEDIKQQMVFLQASQEQTRALKKTLEEREAENQRLLHHMETMNQLQDSLHDARRRSEELAKSLEETECAFEKAKQQCREKEDYLADFNREIIVVKHERDQEKAMVAELSTEVQLLRDKLDKRLEDVNRLSQVLQDTQTQVQILETKVMSCVQEKEQLQISLRQIEAQKNHLETQLQDEKQESERLIPALQMFKPNQKPSIVDSGHGTLSDVLEINSDYRFQNNELNIVREKLKRKEQETEILRSRAQSLQSEIDTLHAAIRIGSMDSMPLDNEKSLKEQLSTALLFNEERDNLLKEKDAEVYELKARTEELIMDRDRVRIALEKTESTLIEYMEQQEQLDGRKVKPGPYLPQYIKDLNLANEDTDSALQERLSAMQRAVAHLEEENDIVLKRNYHLEMKNEKLKTETNDLRQTLKEVEQKRQKLIKRQRLSQSEEGMLLSDLTNNTHKEELKRAQEHAKELQEQVQRLQHERAVFHQQKAAFIDQSLKNNESVMSLRRDLTESLATVSQQLSPAVLDSESRKLDRSIRMEVSRFSLNK